MMFETNVKKKKKKKRKVRLISKNSIALRKNRFLFKERVGVRSFERSRVEDYLHYLALSRMILRSHPEIGPRQRSDLFLAE